MYTKKAHIHFVGIGGIGMSGIATILTLQGYTISGCDLDLEQQSIKSLQKLGCTIFHGNNTPGCHDDSIDILVYSSAVSSENSEIEQARKRTIPIIPRALMLAELMRTKYSIAIAGSHGKTTTTSLISHVLIETHMDPTVIIGGHLISLSSNARFGEGDFIVAEADESDRSFLHLQATLALVTNIDLEHLETYRDIDDITETFLKFLNNIPFYGKTFLCTDDPIIRSILPIPHIKVISYSLDATADFYATNIQLNPSRTHFDAWHHQTLLGSVETSLLGRHNVLNILGTIALCTDLGIPFDQIASAIESFKGVERRFSFRGTYRSCEVFDDYGHHPNEIECTLKVARNRSKNKLMVIFQPHRYTRTYHLWDSFIELFAESTIDTLIITDIYSAHESPIPFINAQRMVQAIKERNPTRNVIYVPYEPQFKSIIDEMNKSLDKNDLILTLGAGKMTLLPSYLQST
jgi:UDP-N-acetylmuramate--alanine ligase